MRVQAEESRVERSLQLARDRERVEVCGGELEPLAKRGSDMLHGSILATLFYEASSRTWLSFESASTRLRGTALGFPESKGTSVEKGETLAATVRVTEKDADVLVVSHPLEA